MEGIVNPLSGRVIQVGGSTHKKLIREGILGIQVGGGGTGKYNGYAE